MGINEIIQIGDRIKELRKLSGLTQKEMATQVGIPYSTYSNYENNNREPNKEQLQKIMDVLNIPMSVLLGQSELDRQYRTLLRERHDIIGRTFKSPEEKEYILDKYQESLNLTKKKIDNFQFNDYDTFLDDENNLLSDYRKLNSEGQKEAIKRVEELTEIPRYTKKEE